MIARFLTHPLLRTFAWCLFIKSIVRENKSHLRLGITAFILVLSSFTTSIDAQVFPVQVTTQLVPPYSPYLTDYTSAGSQKLMLQIRLNDPTVTDYNVKLRFIIEGVGITIRTRQTAVVPAITLQGGGVPQTFFGEDLEEYFRVENLDFAGLSRREYQRTAKLPEGIYRFSVEVLDFNRSIVVSNKSSATAWIILNDPPILNLPRKDTKLKILDPTNIVFSWTPRHRGSPNSAFTTEYIFRLVEVWPATRNPYDAFLTQPVLFETTTDQAQLIYGPAEPALIPGRRYAWQVQATDTEGRDLFKNSGRSEVFVFDFGDPLGIPENLSLQSANASTLTVRWQQPVAGADQVTYRVRYRARKAGGEWYETETTDLWKAIPMLKPDTEYEVQVRAEQHPQVSDYSVSGFFKTLLHKQDEFVCRDDVRPPAIPPDGTPVFPLSINDTIKAGGYDVVVREVTANNGKYSGSGLAIVPWLNGSKVRVTFENIRVNERFYLTAGVIKSVWNPRSKFLFNVETPVNGSNATKAGELDITIVATDSLIRIENAAIVLVKHDANGDVTVETSDGKVMTLPKGESFSIVDDVGNGYIVDESGNIAKTTATEAIKAAERGNRNYNLVLRFEKGSGKFGFDEKDNDALAHFYQRLDNGSYIPWKALSETQQDVVMAKLESSGIDVRKIKFSVNGTDITPATTSANNITLNLQGKSQGWQEELIATYSTSDSTQQALGKLNLASYDLVINNLVIVPVNQTTLPGGITLSDVTEHLDDVYGQAVAEWRVSVAEPITADIPADFDDGETGLLTNYTDDMKKVIRAYGRFQDKTYYLFLIDKPKSNQTLGYMPRSKQAGFVFTSTHKNGNAFNKELFLTTIAHELGHGAFNLKHIFTEHEIAQGTTSNLMDYNRGNRLYKYQWDYIHDPQTVVGLFEGEEDGAMRGWSGTLVDEQHTALFDHVYANNHIGTALEGSKLIYLNEIERLLAEDPSTQTLDLNYDEKDYQEWVKSWKVRVVNSETVLNNTIKVIQDAKKGEKLGKIYLRPKHIYIAKYKYNGRDYPIAIYNAGTAGEMDKVFTKVEITDMDQLDEEENKKRVYIEETFLSYFIVAFYEDGKNTPTLMIQVEKFPFSDLMHNSMEEWLKFLKILVEERNENVTEEVFLDEVTYVSQFDESVFGLCSGCWTSTCCRRATEYMMGNTNIANCTDTIIAAKAPYMKVLESLVTASFSNNTTKYTKETYNAASLNYNGKNAEDAVTYMRERLRNRKPVLIGVHYTNGGKPPNNNNRATRHFMVVVGMKVTSESISFRFYDPGRSIPNRAEATSENNLLNYDSDKGYIRGLYNGQTYTLSEVVKTE
jgi:hypothetical protein